MNMWMQWIWIEFLFVQVIVKTVQMHKYKKMYVFQWTTPIKPCAIGKLCQVEKHIDSNNWTVRAKNINRFELELELNSIDDALPTKSLSFCDLMEIIFVRRQLTVRIWDRCVWIEKINYQTIDAGSQFFDNRRTIAVRWANIQHRCSGKINAFFIIF